jgi:hypothetical protein
MEAAMAGVEAWRGKLVRERKEKGKERRGKGGGLGGSYGGCKGRRHGGRGGVLSVSGLCFVLLCT